MRAQKSLQVAIQEGDVGTLAGWLELIAHEPMAYQLQEILRDSILAAAERAYSDGELGIQLILIAARRVPGYRGRSLRRRGANRGAGQQCTRGLAERFSGDSGRAD